MSKRIPPKDYLGKVIGELTVVSRANPSKRGPREWLCTCSCGREKVVRSNELGKGIKSCGCKPPNGLRAGDKIHKLTLIEPTKTRHGRMSWKCLCECGREVTPSASELSRHKQISCGVCYHHRSNKLPTDVAFTNRQFSVYRGAASKRGIIFDLSKDQFKDLINANYTYCGKPPSNFYKSFREKVFYNGIDRVDNDIGYVETNVVTCCAICNRMKRDLSKDEFFEHVETIFRFSVQSFQE